MPLLQFSMHLILSGTQELYKGWFLMMIAIERRCNRLSEVNCIPPKAITGLVTSREYQYPTVCSQDSSYCPSYKFPFTDLISPLTHCGCIRVLARWVPEGLLADTQGQSEWRQLCIEEMAAYADVLGTATFEYNPEGDKAQTKVGVSC